MINVFFVFCRNTKLFIVSVKKKSEPVKAKVDAVTSNSEPVKAKVEPAKQYAKAPPTDSTPPSDFFTTLGGKAPWMALGLILLIGIFVFKDFLFLDKVYFFKDIGSDTLNFSYAFTRQVADYVSKYGLPKWSFNFGVGQSLFPFVLRDPFDIILYLGGKGNIYYLMGYVEFLKIVLGGFTFYYYLKSVKISDYSSMIGGILFSFSGFMIVGSGWYIFSFEAFNMALMLLGFELLFSKNKWLTFVIAIALICISQPFNLFIYGVFFICYVVLRLYQTESMNTKTAVPLFLKIAGLGILAILVSGTFLLENVVQLIESPRGSGNTSYVNIFMNAPMFRMQEITELGTSVMRFFSSDLLGTGNEFKGNLNSNTLEAPMFYCGIPSLILMPQVFQFLNKRVRIAFIVMIALWIFPILFPYFRFALWLFTGNYYRGYSILVAFFMMYYSLMALDLILQKKKVNIIILIASVVVLFMLLNYPYFPDKESIVPAIYAMVSVLILAYAAIIFLMARPNSPVYMKYIFMGLVVLELMYMTNISINDRQTIPTSELSQKVGYNDYTKEAVAFIKKSDPGFYRIDKVYASSPAMHFSINDGMAQDYFGTSGYSPFNEISYILYLQLTGIAHKENELQSRWAVGLAYRPILEAENQVKYLLSKGPVSPISRGASDSITSFGDVRILKNKYFVPLGYTHSAFMKESTFLKLSTDQKDYVSLKCCVVKDEDAGKLTGMKELGLQDSIVGGFGFQQYGDFINALRQDTMTMVKFTETNIQGKIDLPQNKMMYLSIPYDEGWHVKVDGQPHEKLVLSAGMTGVMLTKGSHTIELYYELRYFMKGVYMSIFGLIILIGLLVYTSKMRKPADSEASA